MESERYRVGEREFSIVETPAGFVIQGAYYLRPRATLEEARVALHNHLTHEVALRRDELEGELAAAKAVLKKLGLDVENLRRLRIYD